MFPAFLFIYRIHYQNFTSTKNNNNNLRFVQMCRNSKEVLVQLTLPQAQINAYVTMKTTVIMLHLILVGFLKSKNFSTTSKIY